MESISAKYEKRLKQQYSDSVNNCANALLFLLLLLLLLSSRYMYMYMHACIRPQQLIRYVANVQIYTFIC